MQVLGGPPRLSFLLALTQSNGKQNMTTETARLDQLLKDLSGPDCRPPSDIPSNVIRAALTAASALLQLFQQASALDTLATARRAMCVCRAIEISTAALNACGSTIVEGDTRSSLWSRLRIDALMCLLEAASTEERCVALVEQTEGDGSVGVASCCLSVLAAAAKPSAGAGVGTGEGEGEGEGESEVGGKGDVVRIAANTLRNLALPLANRLVIGTLRLPCGANEGAVAKRDALHVLLLHVGHRNPNTAALVAACLRVLVESCAPNALRFALAHADAPHLAFAPLVAQLGQHGFG